MLLRVPCERPFVASTVTVTTASFTARCSLSRKRQPFVSELSLSADLSVSGCPVCPVVLSMSGPSRQLRVAVTFSRRLYGSEDRSRNSVLVARMRPHHRQHRTPPLVRQGRRRESDPRNRTARQACRGSCSCPWTTVRRGSAWGAAGAAAPERLVVSSLLLLMGVSHECDKDRDTKPQSGITPLSMLRRGLSGALQALLLTSLLGPLTTKHRVESKPATKWINSYAGPYIVTMASWRECDNVRMDEVAARLLFELTQFRSHGLDVQKKLQRITGNATLIQPLTDKGSIVIRAASRSNNQWKENALILKFPKVCQSLMDSFPDFVRKIYKIEPDDFRKNSKPCVIPKGVYEAEDVPVNWTMPRITVLPYSTWRMQFIFDWGTDAKPRPVQCFITEVTTHPKL
ncbi:Major facilitator-type transporter ecdC [Frankliniella fusca]|uniref:Major facilitator-type transporter ecdC n=1 Tax=Frankliniella fusca TaxID=407009 RepID=A0AAE1H0X3_9NEOP|nr:Major facilitator-type transporter ecdC [Frankliniella fusca]